MTATVARLGLYILHLPTGHQATLASCTYRILIFSQFIFISNLVNHWSPSETGLYLLILIDMSQVLNGRRLVKHVFTSKHHHLSISDSVSATGLEWPTLSRNQPLPAQYATDAKRLMAISGM